MKKNDWLFGEWLWQWYRLYKKETISEDWRKQYERAFILHVPKYLFDKPLIELSALDIDLAVFELGRNRTAIFVYDIYRASLHKAYLLGFLSIDISECLTRPFYKRKGGKSLTDEEIKSFFQSIQDSKLVNFYKFLLLTGVRRSEALDLRVSDVDFDLGLIHIRGTKTANSDRYIPLTSTLRKLLLNINSEDYYFPFSANYVTKYFKRYCSNHKLHDLRHTFATRCASSGLHPAVTQALLGHATPEFTLKIYTHISSKDYMVDLQRVQEDINV